MAKDRKIDMVILGLLAHENLSGYDIKKKIDNEISFFWKGSFGSIYPALSAMEKDGLIAKATGKEQTGAREKIYYSITDSGRNELINWLEDTRAANDLKYETLLKLFFGGSVSNDISVQTIEAFEKDIRKSLELLRLYRDNLARVIDENDHLNYYLTVQFGIMSYEAYLKWCREAKRMLGK